MKILLVLLAFGIIIFSCNEEIIISKRIINNIVHVENNRIVTSIDSSDWEDNPFIYNTGMYNLLDTIEFSQNITNDIITINTDTYAVYKPDNNYNGIFLQNANELDNARKKLSNLKKELYDGYGDSTQAASWYRNATAYARKVYDDKYQEYDNQYREYERTKKLNKFIYCREAGKYSSHSTCTYVDDYNFRRNKPHYNRLLFYKQVIDIPPEKVKYYRENNNIELQPHYEKYIYHYCKEQSSIDYTQYKRGDNTHNSSTDNNIIKIIDTIHNDHLDIYYSLNPNQFKNFFEKRICGWDGELQQLSAETVSISCEDCECVNEIDTNEYLLKFSHLLNFTELDYFNINYSKYKLKYPFSTASTFLKKLDVSLDNKMDIDNLREELNNKNNKRSRDIIDKGLMTNKIEDNTLIVYFETNTDNLEFNDSSDIVNFLSYYMRYNDGVDSTLESTEGKSFKEIINKETKSLGVVIKGFADARGTEENNYKLSKNRSNQVRRFIEKLRVPVIKEFYFGEKQARINSEDEEETIKDRKVTITFPFSIRNMMDVVNSEYYLIDGSASMNDHLPFSQLSKWEEVLEYPFKPNTNIYMSGAGFNTSGDTVNEMPIEEYKPFGASPIYYSLRNLIIASEDNTEITMFTDGKDNLGGRIINNIIVLAKGKNIKINCFGYENHNKNLESICDSTNGSFINISLSSEANNLMKISEIDYSEEFEFILDTSRFVSDDELYTLKTRFWLDNSYLPGNIEEKWKIEKEKFNNSFYVK